MATATLPVTYTFIPPPPLPEFYANAVSGQRPPSTEDDSIALVLQKPVPATDGAYDGQPNGTYIGVPPFPLIAIPPLPSQYGSKNVPPLAVCHVCRLCLRPRSNRYHREHPIPINALPPPPSICRRCRVKEVGETRTVPEVVFEGRSNEIKLGFIAPFVPDDAIIRGDEFKQMRNEALLRAHSKSRRSRSRSDSPRRNDITYRHVRVVERPECVEPERKERVTFRSRESIMTPNKHNPLPPTTSMQVQPSKKSPSNRSKSVRSAAIQATEVTNASMSAESTSSRSASASTSQSAIEALMRVRYPAERDAAIREMAREEVERFHRANLKPEWSEGDIRKISREEVERYRQAERKMEALPDAYTHGVMLPVKRSAEREQEPIQEKPSCDSKKSEKASVSSKRPKQSLTEKEAAKSGETASVVEEMDVRAASRMATLHTSRRSERLSRRAAPTSEDEGGAANRPTVRSNASRNRSAADNQDTRQPESVKLREVFDMVQESDPPRWSSRAEPYVRRMKRRELEPMDNIIEVFEEIEIPPEPVAPKKRSNQSWWPQQRGESDREAGSRAHQPEGTGDQRSGRHVDEARSRSTKQGMDDGQHWEATDSRTTKQYHVSGGGGTRRDSKQSSMHRGESAQSSDAYFMSGGKSYEPSERTAWPQERNASVANGARRPMSGHDLPYPESDLPFEKLVLPTDTPTKSRRSEHARSQSTRKDDREYIYNERIVQPADRPLGMRPFDDHPPAQRIEVEEWTEWHKVPIAQSSSQRESSRSRQKRGSPPDRILKGGKQSRTSRRSGNHGSKHHRNRPQEAASRESDDAYRVRFSSKVDVTPTPPDSDDNSSTFRNYHSPGREGSRQMDGGGDKFDERENRGRVRSRESSYDAGHQFQDAERQGNGSQAPRDPLKDDGKERSGSRHLERAFSESPSREQSLASFADNAYDGGGQYRRRDKVTDSMRVHEGSRATRREGSGQGERR